MSESDLANHVDSAATPQGRRASKKIRTRRALADAAMRLVIERGYAGTTVEAIAAKAEVSVRTFHNYFPSKEAVFSQPFEQLCDALVIALRKEPAELPLFDALSNAWLACFAAEKDMIVQIALAVSAVAEVQSIRENFAGGALTVAEPVLTELAARDGKRPDSEKAAALALRSVIQATALAFSAHPLNFGLAPLDSDALMRNDTLVEDVRAALHTLRRLLAPPPGEAAD